MADHFCKSTPSPPPVRISVSASIGENAADLSLVLNVGWIRDGKLNVGFSGWDANKVVLEDQVFELSWGPQGVEGRILERGGRRKV